MAEFLFFAAVGIAIVTAGLLAPIMARFRPQAWADAATTILGALLLACVVTLASSASWRAGEIWSHRQAARVAASSATPVHQPHRVQEDSFMTMPDVPPTSDPTVSIGDMRLQWTAFKDQGQGFRLADEYSLGLDWAVPKRLNLLKVLPDTMPVCADLAPPPKSATWSCVTMAELRAWLATRAAWDRGKLLRRD